MRVGDYIVKRLLRGGLQLKDLYVRAYCTAIRLPRGGEGFTVKRLYNADFYASSA